MQLRITGLSMGRALTGATVAVKARRICLPGDIAVFRRDGQLVAHRVVGWRLDGRGLRIVTKGDAAPRFDAPVRPSDVLGVVVAANGRRYAPSLRLRAACARRFLDYCLGVLQRPYGGKHRSHGSAQVRAAGREVQR